jgi:hypothetical protein
MEKNNYVYILGASHSGSTLLTMLLNAHPSIATVGELAPGGIVDPDNYYCSCGTPIKECGFWKRIYQQARSKDIQYDFKDFGTRFWLPDSPIGERLLQPLHRGRILEHIRDVGLACFTSWPKKLEEIQLANTTLTKIIMSYYKAQVFVDKGNLALRLKYLSQIPSYEIRTIQIVRDGRAVSLTYTDASKYADASNVQLRGGGSGTAAQEEKLSIERAAYQWRRCNEEIENVLATRAPSSNLQIKYEDLCCQTKETLKRIYTFIGIDPDLAIEDFRSAEHHIVGNGMRLDKESEIRIDERWRSALSKDQLAMFDKIGGIMNRRYGYQ